MTDATSKRRPPGLHDTINVTEVANDELQRERLIDDLAFLVLCQYRHRQYTAGGIELSEHGSKSIPD